MVNLHRKTKIEVTRRENFALCRFSLPTPQKQHGCRGVADCQTTKLLSFSFCPIFGGQRSKVKTSVGVKQTFKVVIKYSLLLCNTIENI